MLDQVHEENLIVGSEVRRQLEAWRQKYGPGFFRQFVRGKIDRRDPATASLEFVSHIRVADPQLENVSAGKTDSTAKDWDDGKPSFSL